MQRSALCRSRRELSNAYFLAKFGFDTAENEPLQVCPLSAYRSPRYTTWKNLEPPNHELRLGSSVQGITYYGAQLPFLFKTLPLYSMDACLSLSECGCILDTSCGWCSDCGEGSPCAMLAHELRPAEGPERDTYRQIEAN